MGLMAKNCALTVFKVENPAAVTAEKLKQFLKTFLRRFFGQQFKRSCMPDGPKVGTISLSPRGDWRMPSDASASVWFENLEEAEKPQ